MTTLPPLRDELILYAGAPAKDGSPTWTIQDPVRNRFFHIAWGSFEIISRWGLQDPERICEMVCTETTLTITSDDVVGVAEFLAANHLLSLHDHQGTEHLLDSLARQRSSWTSRLLHNYLFFRIPLIHPDRFLTATAEKVSWMGSGVFLWITLATLALGLGLVIRQWDVFTATFADSLTLAGLARYALALAVAKLIHEFAHAYTAKRFGCHVPTMGVAFLVLWPLFYTDTTDSWKLRDRRERMIVGAAGMMAELTLAAYATLAWSFLPAGALREAVFTLAAVAWVSSLAINLLPFMRFDGYYLLSDWLEVPNLHSRAFALGRWWLREVLFGLGEDPPESFPRRRRFFLVFFAFLVWTYRFFLFLGIALLVYHFFVKLIGIFLFVVEVGWFILRPVVNELRAWVKRRKIIGQRRRTMVSAAVLGIIIAVGFIPWYGRVTTPALLEARGQITLYTAGPVLVQDIYAEDGDTVYQDMPVFSLTNPDLIHRLNQARARVAILRYELKSGSFEKSFQDRNQTILAELQEAEAKQVSLERELARLSATSPFPTGQIVDMDPYLNPGQWLGAGHKLATILKTGNHGGFEGGLIAYVDEGAVHRIAPGATCRFYARALPQGSLPCTVTMVEKTAARNLAEPAFSSLFGGEIDVRTMGDDVVPERAHYRLRIEPSANVVLPQVQVKGYVSIAASREGFLARFWRFALGVLIRESGM